MCVGLVLVRRGEEGMYVSLSLFDCLYFYMCVFLCVCLYLCLMWCVCVVWCGVWGCVGKRGVGECGQKWCGCV